MKFSTLLVSALLTAPLVAQSYVYVPDSNSATGSCNVIPFGTVKTSSTWVNQRYQTMVMSTDLGRVAGNICSLAFAVCRQAQVRTWDSLKITMAQTTATTLSTNFAANLMTRPTVVFEGKNHVWPIEAIDTWDNIGLQKNFLYLPAQGNVVIEIIAIGNDRKDATGTTGFRTGARPRLYAFSWTGTPPATGTLGTGSALRMRLGLAEAAVDNFGMGCGAGPLAMVGTGNGKIGTAFGMNMTGGPTTGAGLIWLGFNTSPPLPIDLTGAGLTGCSLYCPIDVPLAGVAFRSGTSTAIRFAIPNDRSLACGRFCVQGLAIDSAAPGGLSLSDYVRVLIGL